MRVSLRSVSHDYSGSDEAAPVHVLDRVSLEIEAGAFAVLMGASGSGKSTILNLIGAVDRPTEGQVFLDDTDTSSLDEHGLTRLRRTSIGFVFQFFNLIPTLDVNENVGFPLALARLPRREIEARVAEALERVGLAHRRKHYPNQLSGGEMQRVAIGRAIVHRPSLILADEPTGNLDSHSGDRVLELIRDVHHSSGATIVMATHSSHAASFGDYVIEVADGRVRRL